jgi:EAL domain-containing protein (putative c-di-GMP-specific phosphodiesterase class I)
LSVCEGVETKEQVELLTKMEVNMLQGFFFSKPIPENELLEYVGRLEEVKA